MKRTICIFIALWIAFATRGEEVVKQPDLATVLMRSTFKLQGKNGKYGTGFLVARPLKNSPETNLHACVLVTAAHVLRDIDDSVMSIHLRQANGATQFVRAVESCTIKKDGNPLWVEHPDPEADIAVMYLANLDGKFDKLLVSSEFFATDDMLSRLEIRPGDQLFALGFPHTLESNPAGFPVLRSGSITSYPILPTSETKSFFFDFEVYPGNSGGPVFLRFENRHFAGQVQFSRVELLVGIVSQMYSVRPGVIEGVPEGIDLRMAKVTHASLIRETIDLLPTFQSE